MINQVLREYGRHCLIIFAAWSLFFSGLLLSTLAQAAKYQYVQTALETLVEENPVRSYLSDSHGNTWIGTQSGLFRLDDTQGRRLSSVSSGMQRMLPYEIVSLAEGHYGQIFALAANGQPFVYSDKRDKFQPLSTLPEAGSSNGRQLLFGLNDVLAIRLDDSIAFYLRPSVSNSQTIRPTNTFIELTTSLVEAGDLGFCGGTKIFVFCELSTPYTNRIPVFSAPADTEILDVAYMESTEELCILLDDFRAIVVRIDGLGVAREIDVSQLAGSELRTMQHSNKELFFGTDRGLFVTDVETTKTERVGSSKHLAVTGISLQANGLWVASENGITYLADALGDAWSRTPSITSAEVLGFATNGSKGVFIATYDGIAYWERASNSHSSVWLSQSQSAIGTRVSSLLVEGDRLFAGTFGSGVHIFEIDDRAQITPTEYQYLPITGITSMLSAGTGVLIGTDKKGLHFLENNLLTGVKMPLDWEKNPSPVTSITALAAEDRVVVTTEDHLLLICIEDGVPHACAIQSVQFSAQQPRMISSASDSNGTIWLGTLNHGLLRTSVTALQNESMLRAAPFTIAERLSVYSVFRGSGEDLWIATNNGLFAINTSTKHYQRLGRLHGLTNLDFNHGAGIKTDRELFFGGHFGYDKLKLNGPLALNVKVTIWLRGIAVDGVFNRRGHSQNSSAYTAVDPDHRTIEFHFTVNDYRLPLEQRFQHKLEGFDTDWQDSGNVNRVSYQNLPPGSYTFRARGADSMGVWSDNEINLPIEVLPPLWRAWWALLCYFILAVALFTYLKRLNDRYISHRERLKLAEEGSAAFARLEDDYQAQREANEVLLQRRGPSATRLLDVVETALSAQDTATSAGPEASALVNKIQTLRRLQGLTTRTTSEERTDLHALTDEIAARLAESNPQAARAIITNAVCKDPIPLEHATYLGLVIQESLELATSGRQFENTVEPMIYISMASPTVSETGEYLYELRVEDSGLKENGSDALDRLLPLTFHLIETGGGDLTEHFDAGNTLSIKLMFAPQSSDIS